MLILLLIFYSIFSPLLTVWPFFMSSSAVLLFEWCSSCLWLFYFWWVLACFFLVCLTANSILSSSNSWFILVYIFRSAYFSYFNFPFDYYLALSLKKLPSFHFCFVRSGSSKSYLKSIAVAVVAAAKSSLQSVRLWEWPL